MNNQVRLNDFEIELICSVLESDIKANNVENLPYDDQREVLRKRLELILAKRKLKYAKSECI